MYCYNSNKRKEEGKHDTKWDLATSPFSHTQANVILVLTEVEGNGRKRKEWRVCPGSWRVSQSNPGHCCASYTEAHNLNHRNH